MEFAEKGDLKEILKQKRRKNEKFKETEIWLLAEQIFSGLHFMHSKNIIHRDIKPQNLFFTSATHVKIGDFGVSKLFQQRDLKMTRVGTPLYLAPEQILYQEYSFNVDVWSVGCVLYLMVMGEVPFLSSNLMALGQ